LAPACIHHPLTRLRKEPWQRQTLAEFLQITQQILLRRRFGLRPAVRFAAPLTPAESQHLRDPAALMNAVKARARALLASMPPPQV
jgi:hypothetical protein